MLFYWHMTGKCQLGIDMFMKLKFCNRHQDLILCSLFHDKNIHRFVINRNVFEIKNNFNETQPNATFVTWRNFCDMISFNTGVLCYFRHENMTKKDTPSCKHSCVNNMCVNNQLEEQAWKTGLTRIL